MIRWTKLVCVRKPVPGARGANKEDGEARTYAESYCFNKGRAGPSAEGRAEDLVDRTDQPGRFILAGERGGLWSLPARDVLLFWAPLGYI